MTSKLRIDEIVDSTDTGSPNFPLGVTTTALSYTGTLTGGTGVINIGSGQVVKDADGNLLVGQSSTPLPGAGNTTTGISISGQFDAIFASRSSGSALVLNRNTSDGDILELRRQGVKRATLSIAANDNLRVSATSGGGSGLQFWGAGSTNPIISPLKEGLTTDGVVDLGRGTERFNDIYATNGTIQTSDENDKQDIESLTASEKRVAVAAKSLLKKFRWKSAVEKKGDEARIHFGIIAQDLQATFEAEGLDAGRYAMFINSTNINEETGEERSRMGVRYSELLAFIIAAI